VWPTISHTGLAVLVSHIRATLSTPPVTIHESSVLVQFRVTTSCLWPLISWVHLILYLWLGALLNYERLVLLWSVILVNCQIYIALSLPIVASLFPDEENFMIQTSSLCFFNIAMHLVGNIYFEQAWSSSNE
jgi:hypothetical protein